MQNLRKTFEHEWRSGKGRKNGYIGFAEQSLTLGGIGRWSKDGGD